MGKVESPDLTMGGDGGLLTHASLDARTTRWGLGGEAFWSRLEEPGEFGTLDKLHRLEHPHKGGSDIVREGLA